MASSAETQPTKLCFVTVGATASFMHLVLSVFSSEFMEALSKSGYTHLLVQYGQDGKIIYENFLIKHPPGSPGRHGLEIAGFDFNPSGLHQEMRLAQVNESDHRSSGMIISHAGKTIFTFLISPQGLTLYSRVWEYPRSITFECATCGRSQSNSQGRSSGRISL